MSDEIDDLLAGSDSEDEETEVSDDRPRENSAVKQMRDHIKRLEKDLAKTKKQNEDLVAFRQEVTARERNQKLLEAGLSEKQATVFLKSYDDVTPDAISEFKAEVLGLKSEGESDAPTGFTPTVGELEPGSKQIPKAEFEAIMRENPAKGWQLLNSGKVKF